MKKLLSILLLLPGLLQGQDILTKAYPSEITSWQPISSLANSNAEPLLASSASVGATSIALNFTPSNINSSAYVVIDPWTTNCEIRNISTISGGTVNITGAAAYPLNYAHSAGAPVYFISGAEPIPWTWFGAKQGDTNAAVASANVEGFNRLSTNLYSLKLRGPGRIFIPAGRWWINGELKPERELNVEGINCVGTAGGSEIIAVNEMVFTDDGETAMIHPQRDGTPVKYQVPGVSGRWKFSNFKLNGNLVANSCGLLTSPQQPDIGENLRFDFFSGLYALCVADCQQYILRNIEMIGNNVSLRYRSAQFVWCYDLNIEQASGVEFIAQSQPDQKNTRATSTRARSANVATIVTSSAHGWVSGQQIGVAGVGGSDYNTASVSMTVLNATTFTFPSTGGDETTTADTGGTITPEYGIPCRNNAFINVHTENGGINITNHSHFDIRSGDGWIFDNCWSSNGDTNWNFIRFDITDGLGTYAKYVIRSLQANVPSTNFALIYDVQRNTRRTATECNRFIHLIDSGSGLYWAEELTDGAGGSGPPPRFAHGINLGSGTNLINGPTIRSGAGAPAATETNSSVWLRTDGTTNTTLYLRVNGTWMTVTTYP